MSHIARQVSAEDFYKFDLIFAMDNSNFLNLKKLCPDPNLLNKLHLILEMKDVPDPYIGGAAGFENVIDLLEASVDRVLKKFFR